MDSARSNISKDTERPITPWQRNSQGSENSRYTSDRTQYNVPRLQSRVERPTSRRGLKSEIQDFKTFTNASSNSEISGRNLMSRPSSTLLQSSRLSNAPSQLNSGIGSARLNTSISANSFAASSSSLERPVTQQGIAAVRPNTTKGMPRITRLIQDKRYYEGLIQLKARELTNEISTISREVNLQNKEKVTYMHYDQRAKDLAAELIELQGQLADYNIVVDKMTADAGKSVIEQEVMELSQLNELALSEIEIMFDKRQRKEKQLQSIAKTVAAEKTIAEKIVENMNESAREKYDKLFRQKIKLQEKIDEMQHDLYQLSSKKDSLEENIVLSQIKQEAVRLQSKIIEIAEKRDKLREEEKMKLTPEEEKKHILQKVKQDNVDITVSERRIAETKKRIREVEQEIEQIEINVDEALTEKLVKYRELRKREEMMEEFMSSFDEHKKTELDKLKRLKAGITASLENISSELEGEVQFSGNQNLDTLNISHKESGNNKQDLESLEQEFYRLRSMIMKRKNFEKRIKSESSHLKQMIEKYGSELLVLEDLDSLKTKSKTKSTELIQQRNELKTQHPHHLREKETLLTEYNEIQSRLQENDTYLQISALEEKLKKTTDNSAAILSFIVKENERLNYINIKEHAFSLNTKYNSLLLTTVGNIY